VAVIAAHNIWVLPLCWRLSRKTGASLVYNAHELETETGSMTGFKQRIAKYIESHLVTKCSVVSVVNGSIADWYECEYRIRRPVVVDNIPVIRDAEVRLREHLGITPEEMLYIHTGHLVEGRNIPLILSAFSGRPEHVVFLGDGYLRDAVLAAAAASPNIHWVAPVSPDLVVAHVREADVGLCLIEDQRDLSDKLSSPNKLLEPLAAGVPPLCSDLVEARRRLGSLADDWILRVPSIEIESALDRIGKADVEKFRSQWPGMRQWTSEVEPLLAAYRQLAHPALPGRHTPHTYG
jgi:glycosyltransferase involved in cell wall biosynthesis